MPAKSNRKVADQAADAVIQLDNANIQYGPRKVLSDITWTLRAGDRVALTGANGKYKRAF
jgi:ABC-type molybdenum transport system ATPase subunit/photorepair protein PhrA